MRVFIAGGYKGPPDVAYICGVLAFLVSLEALVGGILICCGLI